MFEGGKADRLYQSYQGMSRFRFSIETDELGIVEPKISRVLGRVFGCGIDDWRCHYQPNCIRTSHDDRGESCYKIRG